MRKRITTEEFIRRAKTVHGNKYDYSKVEYKNSSTKVCIICPEHGEFWQLPFHHLKGQSCKKCVNYEKSFTTEQFIEKAIKRYGNKYDYSKVKYINNHTNVTIICPEHGEFEVLPCNFLQGHGCKKCAISIQSINKTNKIDKIIKRSKELYGDVFDFSETKYQGYHKKFFVKHYINGGFWIRPSSFLKGKCKYAKIKKINHNKEIINKRQQFIEKAKVIHGDKYDYSKVEYVNCKTPVCIICSKHGEFWQTPNKHLQGHGCRRCRKSYLENLVGNFLKKHNILYEEEKFFKWLKMDAYLFYDIYLPEYNIAIECQGKQHYSKNTHWSKSFEITQKRDRTKYILSKKHKVDLIYYTKKQFYVENDYNKNKTFFSLLEMLNYIQKNPEN